jgi:hypothetical protein
METRHSSARLSIYGMGDAPTFVIKGDAPLYTEWETHPLSLIKGDTPLVSCVSHYLHNRRRAIVTCVSHVITEEAGTSQILT